jgi:hypothetical protein
MKKEILGLAVVMAVASNLLLPEEVGARRTPRDSHAYIVDSVAFPKTPRVNNATHRLKLQMQDRSLSQLDIQIPEEVRVTSIQVSDREGQIIPMDFVIGDRNATISFRDPIPPHTYLRVDLKNVATPPFSNLWLYPIQGQLEGITDLIPLGTARIQTYR